MMHLLPRSYVIGSLCSKNPILVKSVNHSNNGVWIRSPISLTKYSRSRMFANSSDIDKDFSNPSELLKKIRHFPSLPIEQKNTQPKKVFQAKPTTNPKKNDKLLSKDLQSSDNAKSEMQSFSNLGIEDNLVKTLKELNISIPTDIQKLAIPEILNGSDVLFAAQTGTGKTLTYVLPMIQKLWDAEKVVGYKRRGQRMRGLILVPTRELAMQTQRVIELISKAKDSETIVYSISGGNLSKKETNDMNNGVDVLVATPERLLHHVNAGHLHFDSLKFLVIDEADTLFSSVFIDEMKDVIASLKDQMQNVDAKRTQLIIASATITEAVTNFTQSEWMNLKHVVSSQLHKSVPQLKHVFIEVEPEDKKDALVERLRKKKGKRTVIFCNATETCNEVFHFLERKGYSVTQLTGEMNPKKRTSSYTQYAENQARILVCTDIGSRGLDFQEVEHVILYEFPRDVINYLHRVGRTARCGKGGVATSFVTRFDKSSLAAVRKTIDSQKTSHETISEQASDE